MKHLIDIKDLSTQEIDELILIAKDIMNNKDKYLKKCDTKKLATLFYEPSTRTRLSFEAAMLELGGNVLGFSSANSSSASKGESLSDTIRVVGGYADIIALRHPKEGAAMVAASKSEVPIINAGDGGHSHPTQTLTDLLTIKCEKGRLDNLTIGVCGDLKFGRTVHSLITAMSRYKKIKFVLISPKELKTPEYIKDMGTPDRFYETERDIKCGLVHNRNLKNKQKAIFLDRDGTINKMVGFITKPEQFELIPGVSEAIKKMNKAGFLVIVVTNQPVIARGDCSFEELQMIHDKMETELGKEGAFVDAIYVCPHHTDKGFEGERPEYKCNCDCRKPKPGLLLQAARDFNIDLSESYMIGDSERDVDAGKNAGVKEAFKILENEANSLLSILEKII